jgi:hypothetical protein
MNYIVTKATPIYDNNGKPVTNWQVGKPFTTGGYVKNGMLYLGTNGENVNRWIPLGTYKLNEVVPPPPVDPPPVVLGAEEINIRKFASDRITVLESKWYKEVVG